MVDSATVKLKRDQALRMIEQSGFVLSEEDKAGLAVDDFGLGQFEHEGFVSVDILRSPRVRTVVFVLFPHQTLPQHKHPPYDDEPGKEETIRVLWGKARVYLPGSASSEGIHIPPGKKEYYTVFEEVKLEAGDQYTIPPDTEHWFQGGSKGAVIITFQNRVDETRNIFRDPLSTGCPITLDDE